MTVEGKDDKDLNGTMELHLLSVLMYFPEKVNEISDYIRVEYFENPINGSIFKTILTALKNNQKISPVLIADMYKTEYKHDIHAYIMDNIVSYDPKIPITNVHILVEYMEKKYKLKNLRTQLKEISTESETISPGNMEEKIKEIPGKLENALKSMGTKIEAKKISYLTEEMIQKLESNDGKDKGAFSGFSEIDKNLGGFFPGDLVIIAGRPAMGKTSFACNIALNRAKQLQHEKKDSSILIYSLEMTSHQLISRFFAMEDIKINNAFRSNVVNPESIRNLKLNSHLIDTLPIFIDSSPDHSIQTLRYSANQLARKHKIDMIVVDYLQLLESSTERRGNRVNEISEISRGLKALAKEINVPVISLSQLSRSVESRENKRPGLSDLRDSGSIEQDADVVMLLFREEYYLRAQEPDFNNAKEYAMWSLKMDNALGKAEVNIAKNRFGSTQTINLRFKHKLTKFEDLVIDKEDLTVKRKDPEPVNFPNNHYW